MIEIQTILRDYDLPDDRAIAFPDYVSAIKASPATRPSDDKQLGGGHHEYAFTRLDVAQAWADYIYRGGIYLPSVGDGLQASSDASKRAWSIILEAFIEKYPKGYVDGSGNPIKWVVDLDAFSAGGTYPSFTTALSDAYPWNKTGSLNTSESGDSQANDMQLIPSIDIAKLYAAKTQADYDFLVSSNQVTDWIVNRTSIPNKPFLLGHNQFSQIEHKKSSFINVPVKSVAL